MPQPEYKDANFRLFAEVLEGCLCVLCCYDKVRVDIWVMEEFRVKESWKKLMSIEHSNDRRYADGVRLLAYSKSDGKVLFQYDSGRCQWYDIKRGIRGTLGYFEADVMCAWVALFDLRAVVGTGEEARDTSQIYEKD